MQMKIELSYLLADIM